MFASNLNPQGIDDDLVMSTLEPSVALVQLFAVSVFSHEHVFRTPDAPFWLLSVGGERRHRFHYDFIMSVIQNVVVKGPPRCVLACLSK